MIPNEGQAKALWDKYTLPDNKRVHVMWVSKVAVFFSRTLKARQPDIAINEPLLQAAALLHDIDKNIPRRGGEQHPDTAVRILREEGMGEVADIVKTHPLHSVLDPAIAPKTWEEKLLFLADKMVKHEIITVDKRFALWHSEQLPEKAKAILRATYPIVKDMEKEIFAELGTTPEEVATRVA